VLVRDVNSGSAGADSPSLALLGSTLALFHTYTDGTYFQVWLTTSTDSGSTWSAPVPVTHESGHVQRIQTAVSGATVSLFWSRQDTNQQLAYQTTTDLSTWSARTRSAGSWSLTCGALSGVNSFISEGRAADRTESLSASVTVPCSASAARARTAVARTSAALSFAARNRGSRSSGLSRSSRA